MNRKLIISVHMYLSAFFTPAVLLMATSGGLYLTGIKGKVEQEIIYSSTEATIDRKSDSLKADVATLLADAGVESYSFEYVKVSGSNIYTRPTSSDHYIVRLTEGGIELVHARPSLQGRLIELHKGHGPSAFKTYEKAFAVGLVFIILSGLWLGISAARLRKTTLITTTAGALVVALLLL